MPVQAECLTHLLDPLSVATFATLRHGRVRRRAEEHEVRHDAGQEQG
jgi:hypothetical protein